MSRSLSRLLVLAAFAAFLYLFAHLGGGERVSVQVRLIDAESGRPTTAMVCIRSLDDDTVRLPPDGRVAGRVSRTRSFYRGVTGHPGIAGWVGPVRKTLGLGDNDDRSSVYVGRSSITRWSEPVIYQVPGEFAISLPAGRYKISARRGLECAPVAREFEVTGGEPRTVELRLVRWVDMAAEGWFSGDVHVHHPTLEPEHREFLLAYARAEDVNVVNVLEMGHHRGTEFRQETFGPDSRVQRGNYALVSGQEDPRSTFGHVIGLNIASLVRNLESYDLYDVTFRGIHAQEGALVGYAHFAWNGCELPRGFPWYVTTGELDFVELLQFGLLNRRDYYDYLNLGFRLTAAAGSDIPWGSTMGEVRTYAYTGSPALDLDLWFAALARGRTFVTNGPLLDLRVDGELPGTELARERGARVGVSGRVRSHASDGRLTEVELVHSGEAILHLDGEPGAVLEFQHELVLERSGWIALSATGANGALAHTSPIYLVVDGAPTWHPTRGLPVLVRQLNSIAEREREFADRDNARSRAICERLAAARRFYEALRGEMSR